MGLDCSVRVDEANLWHLTGTKGFSHSIPLVGIDHNAFLSLVIFFSFCCTFALLTYFWVPVCVGDLPPLHSIHFLSFNTKTCRSLVCLSEKGICYVI